MKQNGTKLMRVFILLILLLHALNSCNNRNLNQQDIDNKELCNQDSLIQKITNTDEINSLAKNLKDNYQRNLSFRFDTIVQNGSKYVYIMVGDNSPTRWENYYTFYIRINTCNIYIDDESVGNQDIDSWDDLLQKKKMGLLIYNEELDIYEELQDSIQLPPKEHKKIIIPFDYSEYFNCCLGRRLPSCENVYTNYAFDNNQAFDSLYSKKYKDRPTYYFVLSNNGEFDCLLFEIRSDTEPLKYRVVTMKNNKIISDLFINVRNKSFIISDDSIYINEIVTLSEAEEYNYDTFAQIANGNLIKKYQIKDDGMIVEIE